VMRRNDTLNVFMRAINKHVGGRPFPGVSTVDVENEDEFINNDDIFLMKTIPWRDLNDNTRQ